MTLRKDNYSHEEDLAIIETILAFAKSKKQISEAFNHLAVVIPNRTFYAIRNHWYQELKPNLHGIHKIQETKEDIILPSLASPPRLTLNEYVKLLEANNLLPETIELINLRIRSLI